MMFAMTRHDPDMGAVMRQSLKGKLAEFLPSR